MSQKKKLGVIGGMGPMATAYFMELVTNMTVASCDAEHIEMDILSIPSIPDRTAYILHKSKESPVEQILLAAQRLVDNGAQAIAIPCNTAFCFYDEIASKVVVPIFHPIEETITYLKDRGIQSAGIMATDGTIHTELFQKALTKADMRAIIPSQKNQETVMKFIYEDVKAGKNIDLDIFLEVANSLYKEGAQTIILGCTELSMIKKDHAGAAFSFQKSTEATEGVSPSLCANLGLIDTLEVLARVSVQYCAQCKEEYNELIMPFCG